MTSFTKNRRREGEKEKIKGKPFFVKELYEEDEGEEDEEEDSMAEDDTQQSQVEDDGRIEQGMLF